MIAWLASNRKTILIVATVAGLLVLHFFDRPRSPVPAAPEISGPSAKPRAAPAPTSTPVPVPRRLAVNCGGSSIVPISGNDLGGSFTVPGDAMLHGDVIVCVVSLASSATPRCTATPGRCTVTEGPGRFEIVGPARGELVKYACVLP
jgi:hypothetical protein